jgi:hypothetical protein
VVGLPAQGKPRGLRTTAATSEDQTHELPLPVSLASTARGLVGLKRFGHRLPKGTGIFDAAKLVWSNTTDDEVRHFLSSGLGI